MKLINIRKFALVATTAAVLGSTGCKTDYEINNSQENLPEAVVDYRTVMPTAIATTAKIVAADWKFLQNWMGYWARSGSYQNVADEETYQFTNDFPLTNNPWNDLYYNASSYNFIQNKAHDEGAGIYEAISIIMKSHDFQILTDVYGNIPYSEALQGNNIRTPKYDKGADIYKDIFRQLDNAIAILKDPAATAADKNVNIATNDLVYKGNTANWIKFANTLKLRMLVHVFDVTDIDIAAEMAIIEAEGSGFIGAGQTAKINPGYSSSKPNPHYRVFAINENSTLAGTADLEKANSYAVGLGTNGTPGYYRWDGDPREDKFYIKPDINPDANIYQAAAFHKGAPYGYISGSLPNFLGVNLSSVNQITTTSPNTGVTPSGAASDAWIITSTESLFLQAEARERGIITSGTSAEDLLTAAIRESFVSLGLTAAQADTYVANNATYPDVDYNGVPQGPGLPGGGIYTILSQKWFALNCFAPYEIWTDIRRTDVVIGEGGGYDPGPPISTLAGAAPTIPVRLFYPPSEFNYNSANVPSNINVFTSRVFWDRQ
jgi:hypothetical protein